MKLFKNRKFAVLITVVVIVLVTLISVNRSLTRLSRDIERMFYDGVYLDSERYTQPGIDSQVTKHADATLGLVTVLKNYPELHDDSEVVLQLRRNLLDAGNIGDKSSAFWKMSGNVNDLVLAASGVDLSDRDMEAVLQYSSTISGAEAFIRGSAYNQTASEQWNEQSSITHVLSLLLPVRAPDMF